MTRHPKLGDAGACTAPAPIRSRRWLTLPDPYTSDDALEFVGTTTAAARALADWAFTHGAPRVHLLADVGKAASQAPARRAGFTDEGVVRGCLPYGNRPRGDAVLFSRLPGE